MKFIVFFSFLAILVIPAAMGRSLEKFIIGGSNANIASYPHQLSMRIAGSHSCGASIISATRAVCAAHCTGTSPTGLSVLGGSTDRTLETCANCQVQDLTMVSRHPAYVSSSIQGYPNDISVIGFAAMYENTGIQYISLARDANGNFAGQTCFITGWGYTQMGGTTLPLILQQATITVMTNAECESAWSTTLINDGHICVTAASASACDGDSGGPLECDGLLAGASSWGETNCDPAYPSVYSRISYYADWIDQQ